MHQRKRARRLDAARSALIPLRPLTVGEIMDAAFLIVRRNAARMLLAPLVIAVSMVVYAVLSALLMSLVGEWSAPQAQQIISVLLVLLGVAVMIGALLWLTAMLTRVSLVTVLGEDLVVTPRQTWKASLLSILPMLGLGFFAALFSMVVISASGAVTIGGLLGVARWVPFEAQDPALVAVGIVGSVVGVWGYAMISLMVPTWVAENRHAPRWPGKPHRPTSVITAATRSIALVGWRNSWRVVGAIVSAAIALAVVSLLLQLGISTIIELYLLSLGGVDLLFSPFFGLGLTAAYAIVLLLSTTLFSGYLAAVQTIAYLDLRMRREGIDLAIRFPTLAPPQPDGLTRPGVQEAS